VPEPLKSVLDVQSRGGRRQGEDVAMHQLVGKSSSQQHRGCGHFFAEKMASFLCFY